MRPNKSLQAARDSAFSLSRSRWLTNVISPACLSFALGRQVIDHMRIGIVIAIFLLTFTNGCVTDSSHQVTDSRVPPIKISALPQIGSHFQPAGRPVHFEMTSSASLEPAYAVTLNGVDFVVAVSRDDVVRYIATVDRRFSTPDGIHVGSSLCSVLAAGAASPLSEPGWGFHTLLPSRWSVGFTNGTGLSETPLPSDAKVVWIFQR
jgi:hypothetical protein